MQSSKPVSVSHKSIFHPINTSENYSKSFQTSPSLSQSQTYFSYLINSQDICYNFIHHQKQSYLKKYRTCKPNASITLSKNYINNPVDFLPSFFCKLFNVNTVNSKNKQSKENIVDIRWTEEQETRNKNYAQCRCERNQERFCQLILRWIDEEYFWKTDRQFTNVYEHYNRKIDLDLLEITEAKIKEKVEILGVHIVKKKLQMLSCIVANYIKHLHYYNKYTILAEDTDIYIWVSLGILYHMNLPEELIIQQNSKDSAHMTFTPKNISLQCSIIFWSIDIAMNYFNDLTLSSIKSHCSKIIQKIRHYFPNWIKFLEEKIMLSAVQQIVEQWVKEMMFGYMGIESIGFFIDSFKKYGPSYLYKVILSYFEFRITALKNSQPFMNGQITPETIIEKLVDSSQQWPMVFCQASAFNFSQ